MSAARPLSSLLSASLAGTAVVALTLAAPGTALADPGNGGGKDAGKAQGQNEQKDADRPAEQTKAEPAPAKPAKEQAAEPKPAKEQAAKPKPAQQKPAKDKAPKQKAPKEKSADDVAPARAADTDAADDPAGNNGTIKIDTVPADGSRANRPHPGCAFTLKFFNFDAGQTADITFTGQAPTRSAGPLLSLSGQTISSTPADGALEDGHSLVLSAADLGLVGTPTAAKGWHVKVAVDALEAPGGAKQKVFWLDCPAGEPAAVEEDSEVSADAADEEAALTPAGSLSPVAADQALPAFGDGVVVLSESATRELSEATAQGSSEQAATSTDDATLTAAAEGASTSALPSVLPFTGAAGVAAMLAAGLGAVAAGAVALRAGRRRSVESGADLS